MYSPLHEKHPLTGPTSPKEKIYDLGHGSRNGDTKYYLREPVNHWYKIDWFYTSTVSFRTCGLVEKTLISLH